MYCHKCQQKAVIRMWHHRLNLCKEHYLEWFIAQTKRTIEKYRMFSTEYPILVAVSGGKDSLSLWDVLWQLGYKTEGLYIDLGISSEDGFHYSKESRRYVEAFAEERKIPLRIFSLQETYGKALPEITRDSRHGRHKTCGDCGLVKRHVMNLAAGEGKFQALATGHNLDDEVAVLFGNIFNWETNHLLRQSPVLEEAPGLARKVKPLCRFAERETAAYALLRKIPYIYEECPFAAGSTSIQYKAWLNQLEEKQSGSKLRFYTGYLNAKKNGFFAAPEKSQNEKKEIYCCPICGQATTNDEMCSFCRLLGNSPFLLDKY